VGNRSDLADLDILSADGERRRMIAFEDCFRELRRQIYQREDAAGKYASAVSMNYYSDWQPDVVSMTMWEHESGKPFMIPSSM